MLLVKCELCGSTGHVPFPMDRSTKTVSRCPVCKGGKRLLIPETKRICPGCLGAKKIPVKAAGLTHNEPCKTCGATGFVDA